MSTEDYNELENEAELPNEGDDAGHVIHLSGMYKDWFLDYASYVILERAVPHINDGFKPVHRRILHSMRRMEDGRYNKVANIIGHTMQFHPHGDASIGDALVHLGQKDLLVDCQGNWGNIFTGDRAAASRYIEARLSKFALEVVFNPKTTQWQSSYDGRNKEPITLPVKFPLLLAQGVEGIAVGLASKILPHNFIELIDASIAHLKGRSFKLYPDFPTGGYIDVSKYNEGLRGGNVKVRAKIDKYDKKTLVITEIPFGKTTSSLIESIIKANDKGKIKIKKIDDNTAENVEILVHLASGVSQDKTIDALYAFTDCEYSISPNNCVIEDEKPRFLKVGEILRESTDQTLELLKLELQIRLNELEESWHTASLEKIFILNEIYEDIKECKTEEEILTAIDKGLKPYVKNLKRKVTREDCVKLSNIPIKRISKYSSFKADEYIKGLELEMEEVQNHLDHIVDYTVEYFKQIKKKYSAGKERKTEIRSFETIQATAVVEANTKLYMNREEGFIGTSLKKDELVCECSDIDDILVIMQDGKYKVSKVADKVFMGKNIIHAQVFNKNDNRTIFNIVYRDGAQGHIMMKRCPITSITRDKEYDLTKGSPRSEIIYMSVNANGEAEILKIKLKPRPRIRNLNMEINFAELAIKGKGSMGNILSRYPIHKIAVKEKVGSTLGGIKIWFDEDVKRLNTDEYGTFLGEFRSEDKILVVTEGGDYRVTGYDLSTHFEDNLMRIEKFNPKKVFTAAFYDADQEYTYLKRFQIEPTSSLQSFIGDNLKSKLWLFTDTMYPNLEVKFGGKHASKDPEIIDAEEFIGVKSHKARGKRISTNIVKAVTELEPTKEGSWDEPETPSDGPESEHTTDETGNVDGENIAAPNFDDDDDGATQMELKLE